MGIQRQIAPSRGWALYSTPSLVPFLGSITPFHAIPFHLPLPIPSIPEHQCLPLVEVLIIGHGVSIQVVVVSMGVGLGVIIRLQFT